MARKFARACLVFIIAMAFGFASEAADKPKILRIGLIAAEGHPVTKASNRFAELVKQRTNGAIEVQVFPGGTLGGEHELQDMVSTGTLEMMSIGTGIPAAINPQFKILVMPYLWDDQDQMIAFANSAVQDEMNEIYRKKSGVKALASNWDQGIRHTLSKKPIKSVDDFKGVKIRVPQLPEWVEMWRMLGTNPTQIPFPEVYTALQQGVVDAMECPLYWIYASSFYEHAKYLVLTAHVMYYNQLFINDALFNKLPPDHQKILLDAATEAGTYETQLTRAVDVDLREKMEAKGVTFMEIDRPEVAKMVRPIYDSWKKVFGADLLEKVDKFKAEYNQKGK
jgi:tripartite ATP-independent transporter DctP family solute receptor